MAERVLPALHSLHTMLSTVPTCVLFEVCRHLTARQLACVALASPELCAVSKEVAGAKVRHCIATSALVHRWRGQKTQSIFHELSLIERAVAYLPRIAEYYQLPKWRTVLKVEPTGQIAYTGGWKRKPSRVTVVAVLPSPQPQLDGTYVLERIYSSDESAGIIPRGHACLLSAASFDTDPLDGSDRSVPDPLPQHTCAHAYSHAHVHVYASMRMSM